MADLADIAGTVLLVALAALIVVLCALGIAISIKLGVGWLLHG